MELNENVTIRLLVKVHIIARQYYINNVCLQIFFTKCVFYIFGLGCFVNVLCLQLFKIHNYGPIFIIGCIFTTARWGPANLCIF